MINHQNLLFYLFIPLNVTSKITTVDGSTITVDLSRNCEIHEQAVASGRLGKNGLPLEHGWISSQEQIVTIINTTAYLPMFVVAKIVDDVLKAFKKNMKDYQAFDAKRTAATGKKVVSAKKVKAVKKTAA